VSDAVKCFSWLGCSMLSLMAYTYGFEPLLGSLQVLENG
jgi:hypothetical protein